MMYCIAKRFKLRVVCVTLALAILLAPFSALAIPQQQGGSSNAITEAKEVPLVKGYKISSTSGEAPIDIRIEVNASAAKQMRVETEQGKILLGAESFSKNEDNSSVFVLETNFAAGYEGMLYVYLKNMDDQWVKADAEFTVNYQDKPKATPTPKPTATPKPTVTPKPTSVTENGLVLELGEDECWTVTNYEGKRNGYKLEIPAMVDGITVTTIGYQAFKGCENLDEVVLPQGIKVIEDEAFYWCTFLEKIALPESLRSVGNQAFYHCQNLKNITIPQGVTTIGDMAFYYCSDLEKITLSKSITHIGDEAFARIILRSSHSETREVKMPILFVVPRNSYAAEYVETYHSYDEIQKYTDNPEASINDVENYSRYGAKLKGARMYWIESADLNAGMNPWNATRSDYRTISKKKFADTLGKYQLFCKTDFYYSQSTPDHTVSEKCVLRSPSGRIARYQGTNQIGGRDPKTTWSWYNSLAELIWSMDKQTVPVETGTYTFELYFDGQLVGSADFILTD